MTGPPGTVQGHRRHCDAAFVSTDTAAIDPFDVYKHSKPGGGLCSTGSDNAIADEQRASMLTVLHWIFPLSLSVKDCEECYLVTTPCLVVNKNTS